MASSRRPRAGQGSRRIADGDDDAARAASDGHGAGLALGDEELAAAIEDDGREHATEATHETNQSFIGGARQ